MSKERIRKQQQGGCKKRNKQKINNMRTRKRNSVHHHDGRAPKPPKKKKRTVLPSLRSLERKAQKILYEQGKVDIKMYCKLRLGAHSDDMKLPRLPKPRKHHRPTASWSDHIKSDVVLFGETDYFQRQHTQYLRRNGFIESGGGNTSRMSKQSRQSVPTAKAPPDKSIPRFYTPRYKKPPLEGVWKSKKK